ncbi:MAG: dienelactone hydrolase family protein [Gammaproteobacteria bacterium]|jgi:carboxymethylenebutenolidase|nr:dienelactone hydrolase family protein [Gammaproteobacteria bacterium]
MGENVRLKAADGHEFDAWLARPAGAPRGGLVVLQEIFGVNAHIRRVTDSFARDGYLAIAPALFDRARPGAELGYDELETGRELMSSLDRANTVRDISAAVAAVREAGKVAAIGYCWGGALADLAACECGVSAAISYYGRQTATWLELQPRCPVMYHFGKLDPIIPPETVAAIKAGRPRGVFHVYEEAGHGFNCDERHEFHPESASLARKRTLEFLRRYVG